MTIFVTCGVPMPDGIADTPETPTRKTKKVKPITCRSCGKSPEETIFTISGLGLRLCAECRKVKAQDLYRKKKAGLSSDMSGLKPITNLDPELFVGKKEQTPKEALEWVFRNIGKKIAPQDAPSSLAYILLKDCNDDPDYRKEFCKTILPKYLPTKSQIESSQVAEEQEQNMKEAMERLIETEKEAILKAGEN